MMITMPTVATDGSAGFDIYSPKDFELPVRTLPSVIETGLSVAIPRGHVGLIKCRSSLAARGMTIEGGVIDSDYRGEVKIIMRATLDALRFRVGDRFAQMIVVPCVVSGCEVDKLSDLDDAAVAASLRGEGGFGSTGV